MHVKDIPGITEERIKIIQMAAKIFRAQKMWVIEKKLDTPHNSCIMPVSKGEDKNVKK